MKIRGIRLWIIFCFFTFGCNQKEKSYNKITKLQGEIFGTTYNIQYKGGENFQRSIDSLFATIHRSMSIYTPSSDISRINSNDTTIVVDDMLYEVLEKSKKIYQETDGYFDPTVGLLVNAYGFGSEKGKNKISDSELEELKKLIGFDKIEVRDKKIIKENPNIKLDVNSMCKGYSIDLIARFFDDNHVKDYIVEIGGEARCRGSKNGELWKIGIEKPSFDGATSFLKTIRVSNKSMATSGNYRKYRIENGKKYVHILNPKTGKARESNLLSASVIAEGDCADVDAYSTAFMAMGLEKTKKFLIDKPNLKVLLLYADDNGNIVEYSN